MLQPMQNVNPVLVVVILLLLGSILGAWVAVILRLALRAPVIPPFTPTVVPWGAKSFLGAMLLWFLILLGVPTAYRLAARAPGEARGAADLSPAAVMTLSAIQNATTLILLPAFLASASGANRRDFGVRLAKLGRHLGRGVFAYPLLAPFVFATMLGCVLIWGRTPHPLEEAIQREAHGRTAVILVLAGVVFAPMAEELVFRGIFLGWLTRIALGVGRSRRKGLGPEVAAKPIPTPAESHPLADEWTDLAPADVAPPPTFPDPGDNPYAAPVAEIGADAPGSVGPGVPGEVALRWRGGPLFLANVVVSIVFAALHGAVWPTPIPIFFLSLGLGFLYQRTGSILGPIALHMTFNGFSTLVMFLAAASNAEKGPGKPAAPDPVPPPAAMARQIP